MDYPPTARTTPRRYRDKASYDRAAIHAILDEALVAHLGFVVDGKPRVLPTLQVRLGDTLYLHGSTGSTPLFGAVPPGLEVCVTVTLLDGLVLARSGFNHSVVYRSVVAQGTARLVTDPVEKRRVLDALLDHVVAGRSADCRPPSPQEFAATAVLALPLHEVSAKTGDGLVDGVLDDEPDDLGLPYWAGVVPLRLTPGIPIASADLGPIPLPPYLLTYSRGSGPESRWHDAPVLAGDLVRLEPLAPHHIDDLFDACRDPEVFRWLSVPWPQTRAAMAAVVAESMRAVERRERVVFVQVERSSGRAVGATSYYEISAAARQLAVGYTWLGRPWWRSGINTEAKLLLLGRAFDELGAIRVTWHTDIRNERSQAAIVRLGAVREGVLRNHRIRLDGSFRDTVIYSMTEDEWPAARDRLRARLLAA